MKTIQNLLSTGNLSALLISYNQTSLGYECARYEINYIHKGKVKTVKLKLSEFREFLNTNKFEMKLNNSDGKIYEIGNFKSKLKDINVEFIKKRESIITNFKKVLFSDSINESVKVSIKKRLARIQDSMTPIKKVIG